MFARQQILNLSQVTSIVSYYREYLCNFLVWLLYRYDAGTLIRFYLYILYGASVIELRNAPQNQYIYYYRTAENRSRFLLVNYVLFPAFLMWHLCNSTNEFLYRTLS